ncbi:MAG: hypothetical protein HXY43_03115 [Fischerella sp.]|uniref:hypothetical protein n=1 Tax=Fischerella sp. TaxID=1191 RepID=UPI00180032EC|nr:hypothetical protein [Fischerella sp.]NWF58318.1 hypothetical protein [Fischerella sp.]
MHQKRESESKDGVMGRVQFCILPTSPPPYLPTPGALCRGTMHGSRTLHRSPPGTLREAALRASTWGKPPLERAASPPHWLLSPSSSFNLIPFPCAFSRINLPSIFPTP